ncbi:hypothetical protein GQ42DRAFT_108689, partial [Ramicandelaber brevisporus]
KTFVCPESSCHRAFTRQAHLARHNLIHIGLKPFECPADGCQKAFSRKDHFSTHLQRH